ncbi:hypothetical protein WOLCODRAFT_139925 [Wolfiporia cocos MD-104 SS10]|uniref:CFEM domain-containing protein n=1 Tax=Wolfiporia cocos (strain MD-104) TaxID=742152 RepID=A0A2H3IZX2_WOLCO|nr:hypothetical protein WOLCODRAFT_139925 [Wolfiporia cocos MD-104 SS10]
MPVMFPLVRGLHIVLGVSVLLASLGQHAFAADPIPTPDPCFLVCEDQAALSAGCLTRIDIPCVCTSTTYWNNALSCMSGNCSSAAIELAKTIQFDQCIWVYYTPDASSLSVLSQSFASEASIWSSEAASWASSKSSRLSSEFYSRSSVFASRSSVYSSEAASLSSALSVHAAVAYGLTTTGPTSTPAPTSTTGSTSASGSTGASGSSTSSTTTTSASAAGRMANDFYMAGVWVACIAAGVGAALML